MWFELKKDIFIDANIDSLRKIIQDLCFKHKYFLFIDINEIDNEGIFEEFYKQNMEIIIDFYDAYLNNSPDKVITVSNVNGDFNLDEAIIFINKEFRIVLENSNNDGYFVDCLIREFKKKSKKIKQFKENNWLSYQMGGGADNIINLLEAEIKHFGSNKFLKCYILVDSDLDYPQVINSKRKVLEDFCVANDVPLHVLEKREMENYLPIDVFGTINNANLFVSTYIHKLSEVQKDFIDIQYGLIESRENIERNTIDKYNFFSNISDDDFKNLRNGLDPDFSNYKRDYPKLFTNASQSGLIGRTAGQQNVDELQNLLDDITKRL